MLALQDERVGRGAAAGLRIGGRYVLDQPIGNGGYSEVWSARDVLRGGPVAIKLSRQPGDLTAALREALLTARVRHPGVVRVHGYGAHEGRPFLVLELCPHGTLAQWVHGFRLAAGQRVDAETWAACAAVAALLARAVASVHRRGILHRDINPKNVVFRASGRPVLIDFGLAADRRLGDATLCGTLRSIAPECLRARRMSCDPRSDVYQLGLVLYEMLTGRHAFADAREDAPGRILAGAFPRPRELVSAIPGRLERICLRATATSPRDRFRSGACLARALERAV